MKLRPPLLIVFAWLFSTAAAAPVKMTPVKVIDAVYMFEHSQGSGNSTVIITDANGQDHSLPVNTVGNFSHSDLLGFQKFAVPYHAKVVFNGKERAMTAAQTVGNCDSCHTEAGTNMAPGRIMLP